MRESLQRMYKDYGANALPYVQMLMMPDKAIVNIEQFMLPQYRDMDWLDYEDLGDGTAAVSLRSPDEIYPPQAFQATMTKPKKSPRKSLTPGESLIKWLISKVDTPVDIYIPITRRFSPKYLKLATAALQKYSQEEIEKVADWAEDHKDQFKSPPELIHFLTPVWIEQYYKWWDQGFSQKDERSFANREID